MHKIAAIACALILAANANAEGKPKPGQGFINVPGGPVWYHVAGEGDGLPIVVLHGGPGSTSCGYSLLAAELVEQ